MAQQPATQQRLSGGMGPYAKLALNLLLSGAAMYLAMFAMIDSWADFHHNLNTLYMTLTMLAPMDSLMLATMPAMYPRRGLSLALHAGFALVLVASFAATRTQALIGDRQFIASMVPHHSGAILMCRQAPLRDTELLALCQRISAGQRDEINQMQAIARRLDAATQR